MMKILLLLAWILSTQVLTAQIRREAEPFVLGQTLTIHSSILQEDRKLNIWLPENYTTDDTTHYDVIYLLDGGADEDFIHVVGLVQYNSFEWIGQIAPSIVVGIANTNRKRDFTFPTAIPEDKVQFPGTGGSAAFIQFIENELQPMIDTMFRTAKHRTLIGQSLGGLLASEILFTRPRMFDTYLLISPSLWWNDGSLLETDNLPTFQPTCRVYIAVGDEGLSPGKYPHLMKADARRLYRKLRQADDQLCVIYDYLPDEDHATIAHQAIFNAFRRLYERHQQENQ